MQYCLFALCGNSQNGIHNIILSHFLHAEYDISKITILLTSSLYPEFFTAIKNKLEKSAKELSIKLPELFYEIINGENLENIKIDIHKILHSSNVPFILDITAGRKIMAVGAALAYQMISTTEKTLSYYLLKSVFNAYSKDRLIQNLLSDEWSLTYYKI